jgi:hypothetical protein
MARAIYLVLQSQQRWWVDFEGKTFGPFTSRELAVSEATTMARFTGEHGRLAEVRAPNEKGELKLEWQSKAASPRAS